MTFIAVNGSARKRWNTATLLQECVKGAESTGSDTQLINLYDLDFKGCTSCFACKLKNGKSYGRCAIQDDLTPILEAIEKKADVLVLGSPIYFSDMTGEMRSFLERLLFAPHVYSLPERTLFPRRIKTAFIYTMNVTKEMFARTNYETIMQETKRILERTFGYSETYRCYDTYQFDDYSKVEMEIFDPKQKAISREKAFPVDCKNAFGIGSRLCTRD